MASKELLQCYNFGCNQTYIEDNNNATDNECVYHSGEPYFHDAYKEWTCCHQKSTDFTTFLSFKGCKTGKHCNTKREILSTKSQPKVEEKVEKNIENEIDFEFNENIIKELELKETKNVLKETEINEIKEQKNEIYCKKCGKSDENSECVYHSGQTVFHDSLKYWTCCQKKKFSDFDEFQQLKGCQTSDKHEMALRIAKPRLDWFQTNENVSIVLYGLKGCRAIGGSKVRSNGRDVWIELCNSKGVKLYENCIQLKDFIILEKSHVLIDKTKVEIVFEKRVKSNYWNNLS